MKKLLILDLDNTLIYTHTFRDIYHDFVLKFEDNVYYYVIKRPYLKEFLEYCNKNYRIAFWSAATEDYVQQVIKNIAPNIDPVFVWSYEKCTVNMYKSFYDNNLNIYKRLRKVWSSKKYNASKKNVLILDDTPNTYSYNYGNAIYITKFFGVDDDDELIRIKELLEKIKDCDDVRQIYKLD
jgi:TFIIF-interacting CTD phosphatase-like protein